jgi:hypothetical protein
MTENNAETNGAVEPKEAEDDIIVSKEDLWKDSVEKEIDVDGDTATVQVMGLDSATHTAYARAKGSSDAKNKVNVKKVLDVVVGEGWRHAAKDILEKKQHVAVGSHPPAQELLQLGAVWLLDETAYTHGKGTHARRLSPNDEEKFPNWEDETLRVHYVPDRFDAVDEVEWGLHCRGLLIDKKIQVTIGDTTPHFPVMEGLPDLKDGVIVYEVSFFLLTDTFCLFFPWASTC